MLLVVLVALAGCDNVSAVASGGISKAESGLVNLSRNIHELNAFNAQVWARASCLAPLGTLVNPPPEVPNYVEMAIAGCGMPRGLMLIPTGPAAWSAYRPIR